VTESLSRNVPCRIRAFGHVAATARVGPHPRAAWIALVRTATSARRAGAGACAERPGAGPVRTRVRRCGGCRAMAARGAIAGRGAGSRRVVFRRDSGAGSRRVVFRRLEIGVADRAGCAKRARAAPGAWAATGALRVRGRGRATWPAPRVRRGGIGPGPACGRAGGACRVPPTNHPRAGGRDKISDAAALLRPHEFRICTAGFSDSPAAAALYWAATATFSPARAFSPASPARQRAPLLLTYASTRAASPFRPSNPWPLPARLHRIRSPPCAATRHQSESS
jgi:hypothetical protein